MACPSQIQAMILLFQEISNAHTNFSLNGEILTNWTEAADPKMRRNLETPSVWSRRLTLQQICYFRCHL